MVPNGMKPIKSLFEELLVNGINLIQSGRGISPNEGIDSRLRETNAGLPEEIRRSGQTNRFNQLLLVRTFMEYPMDKPIYTIIECDRFKGLRVIQYDLQADCILREEYFL